MTQRLDKIIIYIGGLVESKKKPIFLTLNLSYTQVTEKKKGPKVEKAPFESRPRKKNNKARSSIELRHSKNSIKS